MPHLRLEYSAGLEARVDLSTVCNKLSDTLKETGIFPLGGIRVRAFRACNFSIADKHEMNTFCDMVFRIGQGRSRQDRIDVGEALMEEAKKIFDELLEEKYFALSLEIIEIEKSYSWKVNSIHNRLS